MRHVASVERTIVDTDPTGDRNALDSTPRERVSNRGGGYVSDVKIVRADNGHVMQLRAPAGAVKQVCLTDPRYVPVQSPPYCKLRGAGVAPTQATTQLLTLLGDILTLPCGNELDYALALDWYKIPVEGVEGTSWSNTPIANLVHRGKYWYRGSKDAGKQKRCGLALVKLLVPVISQHPLLCDVAAIAAVPGHDSKVVSFGARLADAVARTLNKLSVRCDALNDFRPPAKSLEPAARASVINNQFVCNEYLDGKSLLIIDDVYRSGSTANETARALRAAGATQVSSLCAVRTMRF